MQSLVIMHNQQPVTTSLIMAEGTNNDHASVIKLVRSYLNDLGEFGGVGFEIEPFATAGGMQQREIALLNEQQATLLITYMRNSEIVRQFKKALVKAFYQLKDQIGGHVKVDRRSEVQHRRDVPQLESDTINSLMRGLSKAQQFALAERVYGVRVADILNMHQADKAANSDQEASVELFLMECCQKVNHVGLGVDTAYVAYRSFCRSIGSVPVVRSDFIRLMLENDQLFQARGLMPVAYIYDEGLWKFWNLSLADSQAGAALVAA